uniref:Leucine rich repeats and IQ motif containing 3 n=1 Tax=Oncorhynchus tshawytscha TaxID=74940 RepID=A0A8C8GF96_ONCTS
PITPHGQGPGLVLVEKETDPQQVVMVNLSCLLLKNLDNVGSCRSLRVCILADNFISTIDALIACVHIVKLDLKGNQLDRCIPSVFQITQLPGVVFWDSLRRLQLLHLHDNNIGTRKNIEGLSGCPNLTALTLYDTPLSLKGNYRHCIINSIWSLKALDNFVVSDEEIIENWILPLHFKTLCHHFYLNLYPAAKMGPYQSEMRAIHKIISEVNRIQSVYSPTLIIQRWIRGHLTRKSSLTAHNHLSFLMYSVSWCFTEMLSVFILSDLSLLCRDGRGSASESICPPSPLWRQTVNRPRERHGSKSAQLNSTCRFGPPLISLHPAM